MILRSFSLSAVAYGERPTLTPKQFIPSHLSVRAPTC